VTDSVLHAQHLAVRGMRTVVLGGELKPETEALVGPDALATLDRYNFNCGFWGSNGIAAEQGFTTPDIEEAQVKRISMRHTAKRFVISDASKFADFRDATIITAGEVPAKYQAMDNVITV
jgi:DeoR family fructose operon transcriptional repressor